MPVRHEVAPTNEQPESGRLACRSCALEERSDGESKRRSGSVEPGPGAAGDGVGEVERRPRRSAEGARGHEHAGRADDRGSRRDHLGRGGRGRSRSPRPRPRRSGAQFTPANLDDVPRRRVPEHGHGEPADRRAARGLRGVLPQGRRLRRHRLGDRDRPVLVVPDRRRSARARRAGPTLQSGTVKVFDRVHDASKSLPEYWDRTDNWYNFATNVRGVVARARDGRRGPVRPAAAGHTLDGIAGGTMGANHPSPSARTTRAAARSTPASATRRRASTRR